MTPRAHNPAIRCLLAVVLAGVLFVSACTETNSTRTLVIRQEPPLLDTFTLAPTEGASTPPGSLRVFDAAITTEDGLTGNLLGMLITADFPQPANGEELEERIGTLIFQFGDDQLVVTGGTIYPLVNAEMQTGLTQVRAVTGGTGTYLGATGQVTTSRNDDGSYTHTFELVE
jgi:hypothetical protein